MRADRPHKQKNERNAPICSLVLFTDRMVTNCPINFPYYKTDGLFCQVRRGGYFLSRILTAMVTDLAFFIVADLI